MSNYAGQAAASPITKQSGVARLLSELDEISRRISEASASIFNACDSLYGPRPEQAAEAMPPSANTVDSRLGDIRRVLSTLEGNVSRLHQA